MKIYQVDAFTNEKFKGNPAAVCILPDGFKAQASWMQDFAAEMNLSETAYLSKKGGGAISDDSSAEQVFSLKWFTPTTEVKLCGHATLATAHIMWQEGILTKDKTALFDTQSGRLEVTLNDSMMTMNFPADKVIPCIEPISLEMALGCQILGTYEAGQDLLVEVKDEKTVVDIKPSFQQLSIILPARCIVVTARGNKADFVSRVFCPACGIDEDPITGSTHCSLTPFWAERLGKNNMQAQQLSRRGGTLEVELLGDRVNISGTAVTIFKGNLCE
ncbi:MAG: PhzF family phenazine biosynthesis protein [Cocleimonas sp.]